MFNNYITMIVTLLKELRVLVWPAALGQLSPSFRALVKRRLDFHHFSFNG